MSTHDLAAVQRRTIRTLVAGQAVGAMGITIGIATASLLALELSGSEKYAGLAQTFQVLGTALAAYVLARVMAARGRRTGLVLGLLMGAAGAALAVVSGVVNSLAVLLIGSVLLGATSAANAGARYAATDLADGRRRARALAVVVWATTLGAVLGPNLTGPSGHVARVVGLPELTGPFLLAAVTLVGGRCGVRVPARPTRCCSRARRAAGCERRAPAPRGSRHGRRPSPTGRGRRDGRHVASHTP